MPKKMFKNNRKAKKTSSKSLVGPVESISTARNQTFRCVQSTHFNLNGSTSAPSFGGLDFRLINFTNYSSFLTIFDQFKINFVKIHFRPSFNVAYNGSTDNQAVQFFTVIDLDDSVALTALTEGPQYSSYKECTTNQSMTRCFKPQVNVALNTGRFGTGNPWIDIASNDVPYYGVKYGIGLMTGSTNAYLVETQIDISFRYTR